MAPAVAEAFRSPIGTTRFELATSERNPQQNGGNPQRTAQKAAYVRNPTDPDSTPESDPDLAAIVTAWPTLPEAIRAGIVAMVRATVGGK